MKPHTSRRDWNFCAFVQSGSRRHNILSAVPPYIWTENNLPLSLTTLKERAQESPYVRGHFNKVSQQISIQCKPDISRLVGSMERYRDISGSAIYRATAMSQNPGQVFQRVVSCDGAFVCLAANSARRQRISWHLSKFDVALQNRVVEF